MICVSELFFKVWFAWCFFIIVASVWLMSVFLSVVFRFVGLLCALFRFGLAIVGGLSLLVGSVVCVLGLF